MAALDFPASSSSPWTAPNGVIYTWNTDGYWEAKGDPLKGGDTTYLRLDTTNDPVTGNLELSANFTLDSLKSKAVLGTNASGQVVASTYPFPDVGDGKGSTLDDRYLSATQNDTAAGEITFEEITTHKDGVTVSSGTSASVLNGVRGGVGFIGLVANSADAFVIQKTSDRNIAALNTSLSAGIGLKIGGTTPGADIVGTRIQCDVTSTNTTLTAFDVYPQYPDGTNLQISTLYQGVFTQDASLTKLTTQKGFAINQGYNAAAATDNYAFYSALNSNTIGGKDNFNFYAEGTAPSFLAGSTYIGGSVSRNTYELWKSTLTEEQLEQLEAGTLAVPANVSAPGDGSFARAWYRDQQDAETQALLDSGELEYPTDFGASTFTGAFALGTTTNLDLLSNGTAAVKGLAFTKGSTGIDKVNYTGFYYSTTFECPFLTGSAHTATSTTVKGVKVGLNAYHFDSNQNVNIASGVGIELGNPGVTVGSNANSTIADYRAIDIQNTSADRIAVNGSAYGLYVSQQGAWSDGKSSYGIYQEGTAPNFFAGSNYIGGSTNDPKINLLSDGQAIFRGDVRVPASSIYAGSNPVGGAGDGCRFINTGQIVVSRTATGAELFKGYNTGNATPTSEIWPDGRAYFAGAVKVNSGVEFNSTAGSGYTISSNTLDLYEEGTFTPEVTNSDTTVTYTSQFGGYTITGNMCTIVIDMNYSGASGTDTLRIDLPFNGINLSGSAASAVSGSIGIWSATGSTILGETPICTMGRNSNQLSFSKGTIRNQNAGQSGISCNELTTAVIRCSITYIANV